MLYMIGLKQFYVMDHIHFCAFGEINAQFVKYQRYITRFLVNIIVFHVYGYQQPNISRD